MEEANKVAKAGEAIAPTHTFVVPGTGEVIDLDNPSDCTRALAAIREFKTQLAFVEADLTRTLLAESESRGVKTMHFDGLTATITGGTSTRYDPEFIEAGLRRAGMPEDRIREVVVETVSSKVSVSKAKQAAAANAKYRKVIEKGSATVETHRSVSVKPR